MEKLLLLQVNQLVILKTLLALAEFLCLCMYTPGTKHGRVHDYIDVLIVFLDL